MTLHKMRVLMLSLTMHRYGSRAVQVTSFHVLSALGCTNAKYTTVHTGEVKHGPAVPHCPNNKPLAGHISTPTQRSAWTITHRERIRPPHSHFHACLGVLCKCTRRHARETSYAMRAAAGVHHR